MNLALVMVIVALVLLFLAAVNVPSGPVSLGWAGLFCFVLSTILK